ncbi:MAG TPA: RNA-binding protein [Bacteroidota bacterium]|nr:RNA-binding protein [Bacteroidota bacterium]
MQIYVGNLPPAYTDADLRSLFTPYGTVVEATIGVNRKTGESEGYGIVDMPVKSEARAAEEGLRGKDLNGQPLRVKILKPGDPFHNAAVGHGQNRNQKQGPMFRGDGSYRGSGAIRRGGQRGS